MPNRFSRRDFVKSAAAVGGGVLIQPWMKHFHPRTFSLEDGRKRIYIAPDDHTDYFWSAGENAYRDAFIHMIDYYLDLADATQDNPSEHQSRWNCDGSFWLWTYEKNKSKREYDRLVSRIKDGHISLPLNALVVCLGGVPAEAVLRGMYYAGKIERRENLRFRLAISMENQTLPLGLVSLWAGSGAKYSWKGICGCDTQIFNAGEREHEIYWWEGLDGSRILMKWNSMLQGNQYPGGYAEARYPDAAVEFVDGDSVFREKYPYSVIGCFGKGWDDVETLTDEFVTTAQSKTDATRQVIVSNEEDFFIDFENNYGAEIPSQTVTFGNEWDLYCAALAETSSNVKRSLEKLRTAEAIATLVTQANPSFMDGRRDARDQAWMNFGLYWEHNFGMVGVPTDRLNDRIAWQKRLDREIAEYVETLLKDGSTHLGRMISNDGGSSAFYVFNPLNWMRTDYADFPYENQNPLQVIDRSTNSEIPYQRVVLEGRHYLRVIAEHVPSLGYKVFEIREGEGRKFSNQISSNGGVIENPFYRVEIAENGAIVSWRDKNANNREWVRSVKGLTINDLGKGSGRIRVENEGIVSVTLVAESDSPLRHVTRVTLFHDLPRIEIQNQIIQNFDETQVWSFGFNIENPHVRHEEVGAILSTRLTTEGGHYSPREINSRYDWLTLNHFADMSDSDSGVTLSNADCYFMRLGNSSTAFLDTTTSQISVLAGGREVGAGAGIPDQGGIDSFMQRFALVSHGVYDPVFSMKFSLEHQNPLSVGVVSGGGNLPADQYSFLVIDNPSIFTWAVKPADDGMEAGTVVRVWNVTDREQRFSMRLSARISSAMNLTHIETPVGKVNVDDGLLVDSPQQIKTYAFTLDQTNAPAITPKPVSATATPGYSVPLESSPTANPIQTPVVTPQVESRGCLMSFYDNLMALFKS
jgi:alpha-mannosidase